MTKKKEPSKNTPKAPEKYPPVPPTLQEMRAIIEAFRRAARAKPKVEQKEGESGDNQRPV